MHTTGNPDPSQHRVPEAEHPRIPQPGTEQVDQAEQVDQVEEQEQQDVVPDGTMLLPVHEVVADTLFGRRISEFLDYEWLLCTFRWKTRLMLHYRLWSPHRAV